jgi:hypothetical protein
MVKKLIGLVLMVVGSIVAAMFAVGDTYLESDGKSVTLTALYDVTARQLAVINGWVGVAGRTVESGDNVALDVSSREYQLEVPTALAAAVGDIIWIDPADITGHSIDSTSYTKIPANGLIALMKVTVAQDANDIVCGMLFPTQAPELALN